MNTVDIAILERIAEGVLAGDGLAQVEELLVEGNIDDAEDCLLFGIDYCYFSREITFEQAAEFYKQLNISPERACRFRQQNLGTLYI